jgi:MT-A70
MEKYNTFYVDPPRSGGKWGPERLKRLPIREWSQPNALAFLWCRTEELMAYILVLDAWGFRYASLMSWMKKTEEAARWQSYESEQVLLGVRGVWRSIDLLRESGVVLDAYDGQPHPLFFRETAMMVSEILYERPVLLDVFGEYWNRVDAEYDRDIWDFGQGVEG